MKQSYKNGFKVLVGGGIMIILLFFLYSYSSVLTENELIRAFIVQYGYVGVFILGAISGFNLVIPVPAITLLPILLEVEHSFWPTILVIALGMSFGDFIGYVLGHAGRISIQKKTKRSIRKKLEFFESKHRWIPMVILFLWVAFIPLPNEILVIPLAFIGYKLRYVLIAVILGNIIFNTLAAFGVLGVYSFF